MSQTSRAVTRNKCVVCGKRFKATRKDARYCTGACRQRASRARNASDDLDREIDAAKAHYWKLIREQAEAKGAPVSQILTEQAQLVTADGNVYIRGKHVGHANPHRPGWAGWGLEAAGPPFSPPTEWLDEGFRPEHHSAKKELRGAVKRKRIERKRESA